MDELPGYGAAIDNIPLTGFCPPAITDICSGKMDYGIALPEGIGVTVAAIGVPPE